MYLKIICDTISAISMTGIFQQYDFVDRLINIKKVLLTVWMLWTWYYEVKLLIKVQRYSVYADMWGNARSEHASEAKKISSKIEELNAKTWYLSLNLETTFLPLALGSTILVVGV